MGEGIKGIVFNQCFFSHDSCIEPFPWIPAYCQDIPCKQGFYGLNQLLLGPTCQYTRTTIMAITLAKELCQPCRGRRRFSLYHIFILVKMLYNSAIVALLLAALRRAVCQVATSARSSSLLQERCITLWYCSLDGGMDVLFLVRQFLTLELFK